MHSRKKELELGLESVNQPQLCSSSLARNSHDLVTVGSRLFSVFSNVCSLETSRKTDYVLSPILYCRYT